ncbi:MAG TPA: YetF domain-containing protein [Planctomycetota bacterium]|jgi:uncharacterized membrane protein YcaP (DUF421 family)|nr:YetF domain-containing protein [Planctomycetota bacterium]
MKPALRALTVYAFLLLCFRVSGKRSLSDMTAFDFVFVLTIAEGTQQALMGRNGSVTAAVIAGGTFVLADIAAFFLKGRFEKIEKLIDNVPVLLIEAGRLRRDRMVKERVDEADILDSARQSLGIGRLDEIDYAILETNGRIAVIPRRSGA